MTEENQEAVTEEVASPQESNNPPSEATPQANSEQDRDWRRAREKMRLLEENNLKMQAQLEALSTPKEIEKEYDDDDFATVEYAKKSAAKYAQEAVRQEFARHEEERYMDRVIAKHPDFDSVVNADSIRYLENELPDLADTLASSKDKYKMAMATYAAIKKLSKGDNSIKEAQYQKKEERMDANLSKPMPAASVDKRPLAQAHKYSEADYGDLYKEMATYASRV